MPVPTRNPAIGMTTRMSGYRRPYRSSTNSAAVTMSVADPIRKLRIATVRAARRRNDSPPRWRSAAYPTAPATVVPAATAASTVRTARGDSCPVQAQMSRAASRCRAWAFITRVCCSVDATPVRATCSFRPRGISPGMKDAPAVTVEYRAAARLAALSPTRIWPSAARGREYVLMVPIMS